MQIHFFALLMAVAFQIFIACVGVQALYYLLFFSKLNFVRGINSMPESLPPVSVVICAKNEAVNLRQYLKVVLIQQYPQFEVIVVNDQSSDNTLDVLVEYYKRNTNMKLVNIEPNAQKPYAGKKYALMKGIEMATFDTIVVTDADCRPATTHWLAKMVGTYLQDTKIVLGHSPYEKGKGFLNKIIRYENFITAMQYLGFATMGTPYMGVGRNMSYKKEILKGFTGFEDNKTLLTGDDDLLVNAAATGRNTEICIDKDAFMYTKPANTFSQWLNQKKRHLRSGFKYKLHHQLLLFIFALSNFVAYVTFIALLATGFQLKMVLAVFMVLTVVKLLVTFKVYNKLAVQDLWFISPLLDIVYSGYLLIIFLLLLLKPKDNWRT